MGRMVWIWKFVAPLRLWLVLTVLMGGAMPALAVQATLVADAHVNSAFPAMNSGAISNLNVGGGYTALLQFDLETLPAGTTAAQVSKAVLRIYCNRVDTAGLVSVQPIGAAWGEYSVTSATLPVLKSASQVVSVTQAGDVCVGRYHGAGAGLGDGTGDQLWSGADGGDGSGAVR